MVIIFSPQRPYWRQFKLSGQQSHLGWPKSSQQSSLGLIQVTFLFLAYLWDAFPWCWAPSASVSQLCVHRSGSSRSRTPDTIWVSTLAEFTGTMQSSCVSHRASTKRLIYQNLVWDGCWQGRAQEEGLQKRCRISHLDCEFHGKRLQSPLSVPGEACCLPESKARGEDRRSVRSPASTPRPCD